MIMERDVWKEIASIYEKWCVPLEVHIYMISLEKYEASVSYSNCKFIIWTLRENDMK